MRAGVRLLALTGLALLTGCDEDSSSVDGQTTAELAEAVNGTCAPHGERFLDHYTCDEVEGPDETSQSDDGPSVKVTNPDPARLDDPDLAWVMEEIEACSCVCCHSDDGIGGYVWSYQMKPFFLDGLSDDRFSRLTDPPPSNAPVIPPEENNGFSRVETGWPTTDGPRLQGFFDRERVRRFLR